ncbi:MAG: hypothetical protein H6726_08620 [Sandaracinaceae bacterium]|nr:hypothetical protein [Sandaracinaceae bacterium]
MTPRARALPVALLAVLSTCAGGCGGGAGQNTPDAGSRTDQGGPQPPTPTCAARSASLPDRPGATIRVSPLPDGEVQVGTETRTLRQVVASAAAGDTILLADGVYTFPAAQEGTYTGLYFTTPDVTLRGESGDPSAVVLDSAYGSHGDETAPITVAASGIVLADFTVQRSIFHLIHLWEAADDVVVHRVTLVDGGQQFLKGSPGSGTNNRVEVSCSRFVMTAQGRDNVWGYGAQDGSTTCYTGGIDSHGGRDWHIHDSTFEGIYCDASGVARPAHGQAASLRAGMTYTGGLSEHAIHMWDSESGSSHVIERNRIVDCARGIGLGLQAEVFGGVIRNNMIASRFPGSGEHDVGIIIERGHDTLVANNTVLLSAPDSYDNAIELRWASSSGLRVLNNLTNRRIQPRDGATATLGGNVEDITGDVFVDPSNGDLHLASCAAPSVIGAGQSVAEVSDDYDGDARTTSLDVGADQCE